MAGELTAVQQVQCCLCFCGVWMCEEMPGCSVPSGCVAGRASRDVAIDCSAVFVDLPAMTGMTGYCAPGSCDCFLQPSPLTWYSSNSIFGTSSSAYDAFQRCSNFPRRSMVELGGGREQQVLQCVGSRQLSCPMLVTGCASQSSLGSSGHLVQHCSNRSSLPKVSSSRHAATTDNNNSGGGGNLTSTMGFLRAPQHMKAPSAPVSAPHESLTERFSTMLDHCQKKIRLLQGPSSLFSTLVTLLLETILHSCDRYMRMPEKNGYKMI
ncbi:hypothetical protein FHG87_017209 [Trinorchestia longiramus]|nr:hypothetical protein FHG87_017209 [Trinorchestia longiramus]